MSSTANSRLAAKCTQASSVTGHLTIDGALRSENGGKASLTFQKVDLPRDFIQPIVSSLFEQGAPRREERSLESVPKLDLPFTISLGDYLGAGSTGVVYSLESHEQHSSPLNHPPLVAKFSVTSPGRTKFLLREAWFYDELQILQGSVVPWCFGLYEARIPDGYTFIPWADDKLERDVREGDPDEEDIISLCGSFADDYRGFVKRYDDESAVLVLVLERLGRPFLPVSGEDEETGEPVEEEERTKDVYDAYKDLAELGIDHHDVKFENILKAPQGNSPWHITTENSKRRTYACRIVDFELSRKVNFPSEIVYAISESFIKKLIKGLRYGAFYGQHD